VPGSPPAEVTALVAERSTRRRLTLHLALAGAVLVAGLLATDALAGRLSSESDERGVLVLCGIALSAVLAAAALQLLTRADLEHAQTVEREREAARAAVDALEAFQRASLDALDQGVAMSDLDGNVLVLNRTGERLLGMTPAELTERFQSGRWVSYDEEGEVLPVERRPLWRAMYKGETVSGAIVGWKLPDGRLRTFRVSTEPVVGPDGRAGVVTAFYDITDQRRLERKQDIAEAALESERARFAALVERSSDIICVIDATGELTYASPAGQRLLGYVRGSKIGSSFPDLVHNEDLPGLMEAFHELLAEPGGVRSMAIRLLKSDGGWLHAEVVATNRLKDPAVRGIVANVRDITERAEAAARLAWQAYHDPLTGLPNRSMLLDRLQQSLHRAQRRGSLVALLFIDLDGFKDVNDSQGHASGDRLLVEVAHRLQGAVRMHDTVARLGGDEFVVLADDLAAKDEAVSLARRLNETIASPVSLPAGEVVVTGSIGIAYDYDHDPETMLREADAALYRAKARGKDRFEVADPARRRAAGQAPSTGSAVHPSG
jgi:diguanylate cyclase (GGDEF)-like protein/PAS domain S-box-containing protein